MKIPTFRFPKIPVNISTKNGWKTLAILITGLFLTVAGSLYTYRGIEEQSKQDYRVYCNEIATKITTRLQAHSQLLRTTSAFFESSDTITRKEWKEFNEQAKIYKDLPGIQGVGYSMIIPKNHLQQHLETIRKEGFPNYNIKPKGERAIYTSIIYLEPFSDRNLRAFGYDMFSEPIRRKAMELARDSDMVTLSGKVLLVQEKDKDLQAGTLMYVPVYKKGVPSNTLEQRRNTIKGWVYSPYRMKDLMKGILGDWDLNQRDKVQLQIYDDSLATNSLLYDSQANKIEKSSTEPSQNLLIPVQLKGKKWLLYFTQYKEVPIYYQSSMLVVIIGGSIISLLLFSLSFSLYNTRYRAHNIAQQLTSELRESESRFKNMFVHHSSIMLLIEPESGNIIKANNAAIRFYGYDKSAILSMNIDKISILPQELILSKRQKAVKENTYTFILPHRLASGEERMVEVHSSPIDYEGKEINFSIIHDITDRIRAEEQIRWDDAFLKLMTNTSPLAFFVVDNRTDKVLYFNHQFCHIWRITHVEEQMLRGELTNNEIVPYCIPMLADIPKFAESCKPLQSEENRITIEDLIPFNDGRTIRRFSSQMRGPNDEYFGRFYIFEDITERINTETKLRLSEENLLKAQQVAHVGSWTWDLKSNRVDWSDEMYHIFGIDQESFSGLLTDAFAQRVHPDDRGVLENYLLRVSQKGILKSFENRIILPDGAIRYVHTENGELIVDKMGQPETLKGITQDITQHKLTELIIKQQNEELIKLNDDKDRFITILAHDLRSPFNATLGFLSLLVKNIRDYDIDKIEQYINIINNSAENTFRLLEDILQWVKASSGKIPFEPQKLNLALLCKELIQDLQSAAEIKDITINLLAHQETYVFADKNMFQTVLRNLISNSIKFTNKNGQIDISSELGDTMLTITVTDNGIGIKPEPLSTIFDFSHTHTTEGTEHEKGTGFGLTLCKEFVEKCGGKIWAESETGKGSRFKFTMPLCID